MRVSSPDTSSSRSRRSGNSSNSSEHLQRRSKKRRLHKGNSYDEFRKIKFPTFDGEVKTRQEAESWLLGMKKHFWIRDYSENEKARIAIFNLNGRASIWWEHLSQMKGINEKRLIWRKFEKYFKQKYLSERYYDNKREEFYELRLGQMTMEEYVNRFLELLRYVDYIKNEKVKIQRFLSGLPCGYKDKIDFAEPKTLNEVVRKAMYCYEQNKGIPEEYQSCRGKPKEKFDSRRRGFRPPYSRKH